MSHVPDHVENPSAWLDAKERRIKANANKTRRRKLDEAVVNDSDEFRAWLFNTSTPELEALRSKAQTEFDTLSDEGESARAYDRAFKAWRKRVGFVPDFICTALDDWGGLTEKQLAFARKKFAENIARSEGRDAKENERRANAPAWTSGRQTITATIATTRIEEHEFGVGFWRSSSMSVKSLLTLDDGRKLWTSLPRSVWAEKVGDVERISALKDERVTIAVTVTPSDDDPTMGFGKRPTLPSTKPAKKSRRARAEKLVEATNAAPVDTSVESSAKTPETKKEAKARRARERRARR